MPGVKGRRVPGRPGRFDPTIPLHMTTRRSAKGVSDVDMYPDDEYDDSESRRTSFDDASVGTPYSGFDSEPPAKRQRTADPSPEQNKASILEGDGLSMNGGQLSSGFYDTANGVASGSQTSSGGGFVSQMDVDASQNSIDPQLRDDGTTGDDQDESHAVNTTEDGTQRPESRSKLDEDPPDNDSRQQYGNANGIEVDDYGTADDVAGDYSQFDATQSQSQDFEAYQSRNEGKWAEVVDQLPSIKASASREASVESSRSDARAVRNIPLPEVSTDATPMATRQGSPATTASAAAEEVTPARSKAHANHGLTGTDEEEEDNDGQAATQNNDSMEGMEEEAEVTRYAEEYEEDDAATQKPTKRRFAGGRRRAAHSNAYVEAAMRRQLELKQFYRQVTRSMKSCLGELAQITLDELSADQHHHEQVTEYESVMAGLDEQLERRKHQLLNAQKFNHEQLFQRYEAESDSRKNRCRNLLEDIKEQQLINLEYNMLQVNRARLRDEPGHETEDEDGVIPRPKRMAYRFKRSNAIDSRYDSRSRFTMETERRIQDLECRTKMFEALREFDSNPENAFTVMDSSVREAAQEKRRNIEITKKLAEIAAEYDRKYQAPPQPTAEELAPLTQLAELAVKPSLLSQRSRLSSTMPGYPEHSPRHPAHSSLPSQSLYDRSRGTAPPHAPSSFLQVAMEPSRRSPRAFGQSSAPSLSSMGMRQHESGFSPLSSSVGRGADGRPPLAAKPAVYFDHGNNERFTPSNSMHNHPSNHQGLQNTGGIDHVHSDRARLHAEQAAQEARNAGRHSLSAAISQKGSEADQNNAEAARHNRSLPPPPTTNASVRPWQSPITSRTDRASLSGPEIGRRMKREREDDDHDINLGRRTLARNEPAEEFPRLRRPSQEAPETARGRASTLNEQRIASEERERERESYTRRERPAELDVARLNDPSTNWDELRARRNSQASSTNNPSGNRAITPPWIQAARRFSNQSQRGMPAPPPPSGLGSFPPAPFSSPWPSSVGYVPPQAPAVNHLGNGQGLAGPYGPYQAQHTPQQGQGQQGRDFGSGGFRDMNNRR